MGRQRYQAHQGTKKNSEKEGEGVALTSWWNFHHFALVMRRTLTGKAGNLQNQPALSWLGASNALGSMAVLSQLEMTEMSEMFWPGGIALVHVRG